MRTLESHLQYYDRWAKSWEFQALLKARPLAGDRELGDRYAAGVAPEGVVELEPRRLRRVGAAHARTGHRAHPRRRGRRAGEARPRRPARHRVHRAAAAARARRDGCRDPPAGHPARARGPRRARLRRPRGGGGVRARLPHPARARAPPPARPAAPHAPHAARRRGAPRARALVRAWPRTPTASPRSGRPRASACGACTSACSTGRSCRRSPPCPRAGSSSRASRPRRGSRRSASATPRARCAHIGALTAGVSRRATIQRHLMPVLISVVRRRRRPRLRPARVPPTERHARHDPLVPAAAPRLVGCRAPPHARALGLAVRRRAARAHPRGGRLARGPRRAAAAIARRARRREARRCSRRHGDAGRRGEGLPRHPPPRGAAAGPVGDPRRLHGRGARPRALRRHRRATSPRSSRRSGATDPTASSSR